MIADETDNCKRFEEGKERFALKTASTKSTDFVKLVEAAMRVEKSLAEVEGKHLVHLGSSLTEMRVGDSF